MLTLACKSSGASPAAHHDFRSHTCYTALTRSLPSKLRFLLKVKDPGTSLCQVHITNDFSLSLGIMVNVRSLL